MNFLSNRSLRTGPLSGGHKRFLRRFPIITATILFLIFLQALIVTPLALAATPTSTVHPTHSHPLNVQALQKALKSKIRIKPTGNAHSTSTNAAKPAATTPGYNNTGISDDSNMAGANLDGNGNSYSAQDFSDPNGPGWNPGDILTYQGIDYIWPSVAAGQSDNYQVAGQVIPITPVVGATTIGFVGSADHASPSASGSAKLTYTDGTTSTFTLEMTDWAMDGGGANPPASNRLFAIVPHINNSQGQKAINAYLFEMETPLNASKTLQSITFPTSVSQGHLHIFMMGTRASTDVMNNVGVSDNDNTQFANLDRAGASYSNQALADQHVITGQPFFFNGINFPWSASYSVVPDNYQAAGQTIPVTPVPNTNTLAFLGASTNGATSGQLTIHYTNGTISTYTLGFADWNISSTASLPFGNRVAITMPYRHNTSGQQNIKTYVFEVEIGIQTSKTIQSVTLPTSTTGGQLHVFSIGTRSGLYNNSGTSDDTQPQTSDYDTRGNSYSMQSLQIAGITPGQPVVYHGAVFTWPNATAGLPDNYQAAGQTIAVSPVANAASLAFLGSATNAGSTHANSGQATITYTDGTTQQFTLGFADWNISSTSSLPFGDSVAATLSYRNSPAGRQEINTYVFETEVALQTGKTILSVKLPSSISTGQLHVFSISTSGGYYNNVGTSSDSQTTLGNFDGAGHSYSAQALQAVGITPGQSLTVNGLSFTWPTATAGLFNNYQAAGQTIPVSSAANATTLAFLGSSTNGATSGTATVTYTDGTTTTFTLGFADWNTGSITSLPFGNSVAFTSAYRNSRTIKQTLNTYVFYTSIAIPAGETVQSITLPTSVSPGQLHIFAVSQQ